MTYKDYLKQRQYSNTTIKSNNIMVMNFITWLDKENMEVEQVRNTDLLAYIKYCQKREVTQQSIQGYVHAIKLFYDFKISTKAIEYNPVSNIKIQGIKRKKLHYIFTSEQLHNIYNNYETTDLISKRNKVMLGLLVYQGVTTTELYKLEVSHIKLREGQIQVPGTKKSNERILQLESHQILELYDYVLQVRKEIQEQSGQQTERLLISPKGGEKISNYIQSLFKDLKKQNQQIQNAQQLRASVIVKWLKQYNLREVQYRAGHRYVSSTESFLVNETEGLQEEVNQYHPLG